MLCFNRGGLKTVDNKWKMADLAVNRLCLFRFKYAYQAELEKVSTGMFSIRIRQRKFERQREDLRLGNRSMFYIFGNQNLVHLLCDNESSFKQNPILDIFIREKLCRCSKLPFRSYPLLRYK